MSDSLTPAAVTASLPSRRRLALEFVLLFIGVPVLMAATFGSYPLLPVVMALAGVAAVLLWLTPGFRPAELLRGPVLGEWRLILGYAAVTAVVCLGIAWALVPDRLLSLPVERPQLWLMVMLFYPLLSVLPQELIFRPLFFRRYAGLFPNDSVAIAVNALVFGIGHLFYMNPVTILMTTLGGAIFGIAYLRHRSYLLAVVLHSIAGQIVFTAGLGQFFYHGNIPQ